MQMIMRYTLSFEGSNFDNEFEYLDVGGYTFKIKGMEIPFDFAAYGYDIEDDKRGREDYHNSNRIYLNFESGKGFAFAEYDIDSCYDEEYEKLGLNKKDITAKFLSSVEEIKEMYIDYNYKESMTKQLKDFKVEYIGFEDLESGKIYPVDSNVIKAFNKAQINGTTFY